MKRNDTDEASVGKVIWLELRCETSHKTQRSTTVLLEEESRAMTLEVLAERIVWLARTLEPHYGR